jgi:competence protein ComEA
MIKYFFLLLFFSITLHAEPKNININTSSATEIANALNGIGLKKANAIIDLREKNGPFSSLNELTQVKGIGPKILDKNQHNINFSNP